LFFWQRKKVANMLSAFWLLSPCVLSILESDCVDVHRLLPYAVLLLSACSSLPPQIERPHSLVLNAEPSLALASELAAHPGLSKIQPLLNGQDALKARLQLAQDAQRSLDVQYYLFHADDSGHLVASALLGAADRGVRVRLLLDDIRLQGADALLIALDQHPHIEVRIFNPFPHRNAHWLDFLTDFSRVNHRMHNKSMSADGLVSIVGGRNIGDEYFAGKQTVNFSDMDLLVSGPVVKEIGAAFDQYWNSSVVYPICALAGGDETGGVVGSSSLASNRQVVMPGAVIQAEKTYWAKATAVADPPNKLDPEMQAEAYAITQVREQFNQAKQEIILISPYFVPGKPGVKLLADAVKRGVRVRVLTNSFTATDVSAVHAGYSRYRADLLRAGVELFELKASAAEAADKKSGAGHSSRASLHAKVYLVDGRKLFVGSMNLDPRSMRLNTEMGVVVDSAALYGDLHERWEKALPRNAWRVELADSQDVTGNLVWLDYASGTPERIYREPGMGPLQHFSLFLFGLLPVEPQL
jgi:cardiolipin synthase C